MPAVIFILTIPGTSWRLAGKWVGVIVSHQVIGVCKVKIASFPPKGLNLLISIVGRNFICKLPMKLTFSLGQPRREVIYLCLRFIFLLRYCSCEGNLQPEGCWSGCWLCLTSQSSVALDPWCPTSPSAYGRANPSIPLLYFIINMYI